MWVQVKPGEHPVTSREVDVLVGAEGKHVTLPGFRYNTASLNERDFNEVNISLSWMCQ
jgi:hypothetical protein